MITWLFGQVSTCTGRYQVLKFHCTNVHPWSYTRQQFRRAVLRWPSWAITCSQQFVSNFLNVTLLPSQPGHCEATISRTWCACWPSKNSENSGFPVSSQITRMPGWLSTTCLSRMEWSQKMLALSHICSVRWAIFINAMALYIEKSYWSDPKVK